MPTTFTMKIDESQKTLISEYAAVQGKSMAEFMLEAALNAIEDATDLRDWKAAKAEFDKDPVTYSAAEIAAKYL
jgi:thioredoxin-like negative regulator of GroEL